MADRQAADPFALSPGWALQILLWDLGATALFLARAIDIGAGRYPVYFAYSTPLYLRDVLGMIALVSPLEFLVPTVPNALLWLCVLSALVLVLDRKRGVRALWRWSILGIQIYLFGAFAFYGFFSLFLDLPRLFLARLDGEWLGEGWHTFEANALWMITILILLFQPQLRWVRRVFWPVAADLQDVAVPSDC